MLAKASPESSADSSPNRSSDFSTGFAPDPLRYPDYPEKLRRAQEVSGVDESVSWRIGEISGIPCVMVCFEFGFMGGTVGQVSGRRLVEAIDHAEQHRLALVSHIRSGGARVQEGLVALRQMQHIAEGLNRLRRAAAPHLAIVDDPTTGGVWASLAADADVIIAVSGARVSFAGRRVRAAGSDRAPEALEAPATDPSFAAEGKLHSGFVDVVVEREDLPATVARYIRLLSVEPSEVPAVGSEVPAVGSEVPAVGSEVPAVGSEVPAVGSEVPTIGTVPVQGPEVIPSPCPVPDPLGVREPQKGWAAVLAARAPDRPRATAYLDDYFSERVTISGDRVSGADPSVLCGIGLHHGRAVAFAAQGGEAIGAAGVRTVTRLLRLAERLRLPVLTLVDTPGAASDAAAEDAGIGTAIAQALGAIAALTVPMTTLVIGEGVSGGALAMCAPTNTWVTADAYISVISPEGAAAILARDPSGAEDLAARLRVEPQAAVDLGLAVGIALSRC